MNFGNYTNVSLRNIPDTRPRKLFLKTVESLVLAELDWNC